MVENSTCYSLPDASTPTAGMSRRRFAGLCASTYVARMLGTAGAGLGWLASPRSAHAVGPLAAFTVAQTVLSAVTAFSNHGDGGIGAMFNALNEKLGVIEQHLDRISVQISQLSSQIRETKDEIIQAIAWNNFEEIAASLTGYAQEYTRLLRADGKDGNYLKTVTGKMMLESLLERSKALSGKLQNLPEVGLSPSAAILAPLACSLEVALVRRLAEANGDGRACESYVKVTLENYVRWMDRFLAPGAATELKLSAPKEVPNALVKPLDGSPPRAATSELNQGSLYERIQRTAEKHDSIIDGLLKLPIGTGLHLDNFKLGQSQEVMEGVASCLVWAQGQRVPAIAVAPQPASPDGNPTTVGVLEDGLDAWNQLTQSPEAQVSLMPGLSLSVCATVVRGKVERILEQGPNCYSLSYHPVSRSVVWKHSGATGLEGTIEPYDADAGSYKPAQPSPAAPPKARARVFGRGGAALNSLPESIAAMNAPDVRAVIDQEQGKFDVSLAQLNQLRALMAYVTQAISVAQNARQMMQEELK